MKRLLQIFSCGSLFFAASRWHSTIFNFSSSWKKIIGRLITRADNSAFTTSDPLLSADYDRWPAKSAVLSATLRRRRRRRHGGGGVKVLFISNIFRDSEFNHWLLRPTVIERPNYDGLGCRWGGRVGMYLESCLFKKRACE